MPCAEQVKIKSAIRALALDPSSKLHGLNMANMNESASVDDFFALQLAGYVTQARSIIDIWAKDSDVASGDVDAGGGGQETPIKDTKGKAVERGRETKGGKASDRSKRDKSAQRKVPPEPFELSLAATLPMMTHQVRIYMRHSYPATGTTCSKTLSISVS